MTCLNCQFKHECLKTSGYQRPLPFLVDSGQVNEINTLSIYTFRLPWLLSGKELPEMQETQEMQVQSLGGEDILEKEMAVHSVFLPGNSHGQRSLADCSPWGPKESDTTKHRACRWMLTRLTVVNVSQYIQIPSHYVILMKLIQFYLPSMPESC